MNKKIKLIVFFVSSVLFLNTSSASADPTYAMLDANGNVTNIIVCGEACSGGTWMGQKVVLQVAADPVTGENRGGYWQGPGTTVYNQDTETFTVNTGNNVVNSQTILESDNTETIVTATVYQGTGYSFKYEDTLGVDGLTLNKMTTLPILDESDAKISTNNNEIMQSIFFENRKTSEEILQISENSNLLLLNSKIQVLIALLGSWVK